MMCPVPHETLVRYWANDLADDEVDEVDDHVFGCAACFEASSRIAAFADALASVIPPIAVGRDIENAAARGLAVTTNDFVPGVEKEAWLHPGTDLLVHRLLGDLTDVSQITVDIVGLDGTPMVSFGDVPFDPSGGAVLVACRRHFVETFPPDVGIVVRRKHRDGRQSAEQYEVRHRVG